MATYDAPAPARELTIPEAAGFLQEAAIRVGKASEVFLAARAEWRDARADLANAWLGYVAAKERQDDPEITDPRNR